VLYRDNFEEWMDFTSEHIFWLNPGLRLEENQSTLDAWVGWRVGFFQMTQRVPKDAAADDGVMGYKLGRCVSHNGKGLLLIEMDAETGGGDAFCDGGLRQQSQPQSLTWVAPTHVHRLSASAHVMRVRSDGNTRCLINRRFMMRLRRKRLGANGNKQRQNENVFIRGKVIEDLRLSSSARGGGRKNHPRIPSCEFLVKLRMGNGSSHYQKLHLNREMIIWSPSSGDNTAVDALDAIPISGHACSGHLGALAVGLRVLVTTFTVKAEGWDIRAGVVVSQSIAAGTYKVLFDTDGSLENIPASSSPFSSSSTAPQQSKNGLVHYLDWIGPVGDLESSTSKCIPTMLPIETSRSTNADVAPRGEHVECGGGEEEAVSALFLPSRGLVLYRGKAMSPGEFLSLHQGSPSNAQSQWRTQIRVKMSGVKRHCLGQWLQMHQIDVEQSPYWNMLRDRDRDNNRLGCDTESADDICDGDVEEEANFGLAEPKSEGFANYVIHRYQGMNPVNSGQTPMPPMTPQLHQNLLLAEDGDGGSIEDKFKSLFTCLHRNDPVLQKLLQEWIDLHREHFAVPSKSHVQGHRRTTLGCIKKICATVKKKILLEDDTKPPKATVNIHRRNEMEALKLIHKFLRHWSKLCIEDATDSTEHYRTFEGMDAITFMVAILSFSRSVFDARGLKTPYSFFAFERKGSSFSFLWDFANSEDFTCIGIGTVPSGSDEEEEEQMERRKRKKHADVAHSSADVESRDCERVECGGVDAAAEEEAMEGLMGFHQEESAGDHDGGTDDDAATSNADVASSSRDSWESSSPDEEEEQEEEQQHTSTTSDTVTTANEEKREIAFAGAGTGMGIESALNNATRPVCVLCGKNCSVHRRHPTSGKIISWRCKRCGWQGLKGQKENTNHQLHAGDNDTDNGIDTDIDEG